MCKRIILLSLASFLLSFSNAQMVNHIDSKTFKSLIKSKEGIVLDVRTAQEYSRGHIENSTLISINDPKIVEKINLLQKTKPIYIYCLTGSRSAYVANYLVKNGFSKVYNLQRGIMEWQQHGFSVVKSANPVASSSKSYSQNEFNKLLSSKKLVLIDFHAPWCAPCKKMSPIIEELQGEYVGKVTIEKLDITSNEPLKNKYRIETIPGFVLFKNGKEIWRHTGTISKVELHKVINKFR